MEIFKQNLFYKHCLTIEITPNLPFSKQFPQPLEAFLFFINYVDCLPSP